MAYTLEFPLNAGDPAPLRSIAAAVDQIAQRTKLSAGELKVWEQYVKQGVESGLSLNRVLAQAQTAFGQAGGAMGIFTVALRDHISEQNKLATTLQSHTIPQIAGASAAIRGLEGAMNVRAAERFLTTFSGIGTVLQGAFPVFGAMALLEVTGRLVEKIGGLYNAWNPVVRAQERSLQMLKESLPELQKLTAESERLTAQTRERQFGKGYAARLDVQSNQHEEDFWRARAAELEARIKAGTIPATPPSTVIGKGGAEFQKPGTPESLTMDAQAARELAVGVNAKLEDVLKQKTVNEQKSGEAKAEFEKQSLEKAKQRQRETDEFNKRTAEIRERSLSLSDKAEMGSFYGIGKIGDLEVQRRAMERRYDRDEADLAERRRQNKLGGPDTVRLSDSVFEDQAKEIQRSRALDEGSLNKEIVAAARELGDARKIDRELLTNISRESQGARLETLSKSLFGNMFKDLPAQYAADEQIDTIQAGAQREGIIRQSNQSQRIAQISGTGVGAGYQARLQLAKQLQELDLSTALKVYDKTGDINKLRVDGAKAEADLLKATAEARLDAEVRVLELRKQQQDMAENFAKGAFGAFLTGKTRGIDEFVKGKVFGLGETLVGNAAGMAFKAVGGNPLSVPGLGTMASPTALGSLLKGTPFGIDPVKDAQITSTQANTAALDSLTKELLAWITRGQAGQLPGGVSATGYLDTPLPLATGVSGASMLNVPGLPGFTGDVVTAATLTTAAAGVASGIATGSTVEAFAAKAIQSSPSFLALLGNTQIPTGNTTQPVGPTLAQLGAPGTTPGATIPLSSLLGPAVAGGLGTLGLIQGLSQGGPKGILTAAGGAAGVVSAVSSGLKAIGDLSSVLSAVPIVGSILGAALPLIGSLFGSNPQIRQRDITRTLENQQFYAPVAINTNQDVSGSITSYNSRGQLRVSPGASPYPSGLQEPYYLYPTHPIFGNGTPGVNVPGTGGQLGAPLGTPVGDLNPAGGPAATPVIIQHNYNIQAMDSGDVATFFANNHQHIADATVKALHSGGNGLLETMRSQIAFGH